MTRFCLRELIHPTPKPEFMADYWPGRPHVSHGSVARFGDLSRIPELQSVRNLCAVVRSPLFIFGKKGFRTSLKDAVAAANLYEHGETLYFTNLEREIPRLAGFAAKLAGEFGVRPEHVSCEAFASLDGSGSSMHFDYEQNFNIQVRGRKTWQVAPNDCVVNPLESHVVGENTAVSLELKSYSRKPYPKRMPADARTVEMREGSALFLPRGYWHQTKVVGESFAVGFAIKPPYWRNVMLDALQTLMTADARWRDFPFGIEGNERQRQKLRRIIASLLPGLSELVLSMDPLELIPPARKEIREPEYRWPHRMDKRLVSRRRQGFVQWFLSASPPGKDAVKLEVEDVFLPLVRWLMRQRAPFAPPRASKELGILTQDQIEAMLEVFYEIGVLKAESGGK